MSTGARRAGEGRARDGGEQSTLMPMHEALSCSCGAELVTYGRDGGPLCLACLRIVRRQAAGLRPSLTACTSCGLDHQTERSQ